MTRGTAICIAGEVVTLSNKSQGASCRCTLRAGEKWTLQFALELSHFYWSTLSTQCLLWLTQDGVQRQKWLGGALGKPISRWYREPGCGFWSNCHNKKHSNVVSVLFYIFALWTLIWNCVENSDGAVKVTVLTVLKTSEDILGLTGFSRCWSWWWWMSPCNCRTLARADYSVFFIIHDSEQCFIFADLTPPFENKKPLDTWVGLKVLSSSWPWLPTEDRTWGDEGRHH